MNGAAPLERPVTTLGSLGAADGISVRDPVHDEAHEHPGRYATETTVRRRPSRKERLEAGVGIEPASTALQAAA